MYFRPNLIIAMIFYLWCIGKANGSCEDHRICRRYEMHKKYYCKQNWVQKRCQAMCMLCIPECKDHKICPLYAKNKSYYCRHKWMREHYCPAMCGHCRDRCEQEDHERCKLYANAPSFYCPHKWLRKNCNRMCGRCADTESPRWPEGEYAVLSRDPCPPTWVEFNHCMDNENDDNKDELSDYRLSPKFKCEESSVSFRYCFKGPKVPTRKGGFWSKNGTNDYAYVVRSPLSECNVFGDAGGVVEIDNEDTNNRNSYGNKGLNRRYFYNYHPSDFILSRYPRTRLSFCKIGGKGSPNKNNFIEVGHFNYQRFGLFVTPGRNCPKLDSPYGIMEGSQQDIFTDDENHLGSSRILRGHPPVFFKNGGTNWSVCEYNPNTGKRH